MNNHFIQSKALRRIIIGLLSVIVALVIFRAGMMVGFRQAGFSSRWGQNYFQNFGGPNDFERGMPNHGLLEAHGSLGTVIKIDPTDIVVQGRDGIEKIILVSDSTMIRRDNDMLKLGDLHPNDTVIVIGSPNENGQIEAQLIRVLAPNDMPPPVPQASGSFSTSSISSSTIAH